jgi:AraC-like DNA-binding protein
LIDAALFRETALQYVERIPVFRGETFAPHPELLSLLKCFMLEGKAYEGKNSEYLNELAHVITHLLARSVFPGLCEKTAVPLYDRFDVDQAIAYMNSHFMEKITAKDLADIVNLSLSQFTKIFKSVTRETPIDFLNTLRLNKARSMLIHTTENMTDIALKCGFNTSSYFSSSFLEKYGMTPTAYRRTFDEDQKNTLF